MAAAAAAAAAAAPVGGTISKILDAGEPASYRIALDEAGWAWAIDNEGSPSVPRWVRGLILFARWHRLADADLRPIRLTREREALLVVYAPGSPLRTDAGSFAGYILANHMNVLYRGPDERLRRGNIDVLWPANRPELYRAGEVGLTDATGQTAIARAYPAAAALAHFRVEVGQVDHVFDLPFFANLATAFQHRTRPPQESMITPSWRRFLRWEDEPTQTDTGHLLALVLEPTQHARPMHTFLAAWASALATRVITTPSDILTLTRAIAILARPANFRSGADSVLVELVRFLQRSEPVDDPDLLARVAHKFAAPVSVDDYGQLVHSRMHRRWERKTDTYEFVDRCLNG